MKLDSFSPNTLRAISNDVLRQILEEVFEMQTEGRLADLVEMLERTEMALMSQGYVSFVGYKWTRLK